MTRSQAEKDLMLEAANAELKLVRADVVALRDSSELLVHTLAHPCTPLHTLAHPCTPLHTLAQTASSL
jgi:hypothetical protein